MKRLLSSHALSGKDSKEWEREGGEGHRRLGQRRSGRGGMMNLGEE